MFQFNSKIKDYISNNLEDCFKDGGKVLYNQLPTPGHNNVNTVFTVEEDFTRTEELFGVNGGVYNKGTAVKFLHSLNIFCISVTLLVSNKGIEVKAEHL